VPVGGGSVGGGVSSGGGGGNTGGGGTWPPGVQCGQIGGGWQYGRKQIGGQRCGCGGAAKNKKLKRPLLIS